MIYNYLYEEIEVEEYYLENESYESAKILLLD